MGEMKIRIVLLAIGVMEIIIGTNLLMPWFTSTVTYVHPAKAFYGSILLIGFGGFMLALGSIGFRGFTKMTCGKLLLGEMADANGTTQKANATDSASPSDLLNR